MSTATNTATSGVVWLSVKVLADRLGTTPYFVLTGIRDGRHTCRIVRTPRGKRRLEVLETPWLARLAAAHARADDKLLALQARKPPLHGCATSVN